MIDVGGPSMLRGAAKNFAHCAPVCRPEPVRPGARGAARERRALARDAPRLAAEAFAHTAAYEAAIATWFNAREEFPDSLVVSLDKVLDLAYGENPHQRGRVLRRARRPPPPPLARRAAAREGALLQQPQRPLGRALARARVRAAGLRDRQAREPVRRRGRRHARGGVRQGARLRPDLGLRRRRRPQPARSRRRSGRSSRSSSSRCCSRRATPRTRSTRCGGRRTRASSSTASGAPASPASGSYKRVLGGMLVQDPDAEIEERDGWRS